MSLGQSLNFGDACGSGLVLTIVISACTVPATTGKFIPFPFTLEFSFKYAYLNVFSELSCFSAVHMDCMQLCVCAVVLVCYSGEAGINLQVVVQMALCTCGCKCMCVEKWCLGCTSRHQV